MWWIVLVVVALLVLLLFLRSRKKAGTRGPVDQRNVDRVRRDGQSKGFGSM
jgi:hypothetical protein